MLKWVLLAAGCFLALLILLVVALAFAPGSNDNNTNNGGQNTSQPNNNSNASNGCTETLRLFSNTDLGFRFCYPEVWGDVAVQDARFAATDAGSRYRLAFSEKPAVNLGVQSEGWATSEARDGTCVDPANALPNFADFRTAWRTEPSEGEVVFGMRGIEVRADQFLFTEEVSNMLDDGACLRGDKVISGRAYNHVSGSYFAAFDDEVQTPQQHIDRPNHLIPRQERTDFTAVMKSVEAL